MVARPDTGGDARPASVTRAAALFLWWRRALTSALTATRRWVSAGARSLPRLTRFPRLLLRFVSHPASAATDDGERRVLAVAGGVALVTGAVLSVTLAPALHVPVVQAAVAAVWTLGWAALRLGILRAASWRISPRTVLLAWAAGLLPGAAGVTETLRALALAASAWLTFGALVGAGVRRREAGSAVAWAFGAEVTATLLRWVASGLLFYAVAR